MSRYIDADKLQKDGWKLRREKHRLATSTFEIMELDCVPIADVVEADKAQKEIDYWHDKAQSYEQTILKLSLNKADVVEVEKLNKIYEKLADLFDIPCNYSPCDETMLESERCREDCGNISDAECWKRYFEVVCDGERADA